MDISVVIPTLNSAAVIQRALDALLNGAILPYEIIVVDGGSTDQTVAKTQQYPVQVLPNPMVHAAAARNIGIRHAKGQIVAFTDSDCIPNPDWLKQIQQHFMSNKDLIGVGGKMLALPPTNRIEAFSGYVFLAEIMQYRSEMQMITRPALAGAFITANCAYRCDVLEEIGGFREIFANFGEDIDLFWRLIGVGPLCYDPHIVVYHSFPSKRSSLARKYFQYGIASSMLARHHLKTPAIDLRVYRKLLDNLWKLLSRSQDEKADLYCIQLAAHIAGKMYGSLSVRRLNL